MKPSIKIALIYFAFGILWILVSDKVLLLFFSNDQLQLSYFQTIKGIFYVFLTAFLLYILVRRYYKSINQKIEELKQINVQLNKQAKELEAINKDMEEFTYVASHDLKAPLRMVTGFLTRLQDKYQDKLDDKGNEYINFAVDGAQKMRQSITDLLDFSKSVFHEHHYESVNLNEVLTEVKRLLSVEINKTKAAINSTTLPTVKTDKTAICHVFQNLIDNAIKYRKKGEQPLIDIKYTEKESTHIFSVSDNGIGINKVYFDKIFKLFQRLHQQDKYKGTGLGLAIAKKNIERLGGKISLESEEGKGTTFYVEIPKKIINAYDLKTTNQYK